MGSIKLVKQDATLIAIGCNSHASGDHDASIAIGYGAQAWGCAQESVSIGYNARGNYGAIAIGDGAIAPGCGSVAIGTRAYGDKHGIAIGQEACATDLCTSHTSFGDLYSNSVAIGVEACALAFGATAIGYQAKAGTDGASGAKWGTAIGCGAVACGCGLAIGPGTSAISGEISIGTGGDECTVCFTQFKAVMSGTTAVELASAPTDAPITAFCSVTTSKLGYTPRTTTITPMGIVGSNGVTVSSSGQTITITGPGSGLKGATTSTYTTLGEGACANRWGIAVGNSASVTNENGIAIGGYAQVGTNGVTIGYFSPAPSADSWKNAITIGYNASGAFNAVTIGACAVGRYGPCGSSIAIGYKADPKTDSAVAFSNGNENVYMTWDNFKAMLVAAGATVETITE